MKLTNNLLGRCIREKEKCAWWIQLDNCCSVWQLHGSWTTSKRK
nr:MAG TPA: hypothetical protein [Caudoviricetes sp.]